MPCEWMCLGEIVRGSEGLKFPLRPIRGLDIPGIYRLKMRMDGNEYVYIGRSENLLRRPMHDYSRPTAGVEVENVIHRMLLDATSATVELMPILDGNTARAETQEQERAFQENRLLLNVIRGKGPGLGYAHYLKYKIKYYRQMLDFAEADYAAL